MLIVASHFIVAYNLLKFWKYIRSYKEQKKKKNENIFEDVCLLNVYGSIAELFIRVPREQSRGRNIVLSRSAVVSYCKVDSIGTKCCARSSTLLYSRLCIK